MPKPKVKVVLHGTKCSGDSKVEFTINRQQIKNATWTEGLILEIGKDTLTRWKFVVKEYEKLQFELWRRYHKGWQKTRDQE